MNEASVLAAGRCAIVQLGGRNYPGIVVQGDTLNGAATTIGRAISLLRDGSCGEAAAELNLLLEDIFIALDKYEHVCNSRGIDIPYQRSI